MSEEEKKVEEKKEVQATAPEPEKTASRILPPELRQQYDVEMPVDWKVPPDWLLRSVGGARPPGSGFGYTVNPYAIWYDKVYGAVPSADLPKYKILYRNNPDIKASIDLQALLATAKGFIVGYPVREVREFLTKWLDKINIQEHFQRIVKDILTYGNAFCEILWSETIEERQILNVTKQDFDLLQMPDGKTAAQYVAFAGNNEYTVMAKHYRKAKKEETKNNEDPVITDFRTELDPVYMRVRRDAWNNIFGYLQWINYPPVDIPPESMMHFKWSPSSTGYESIYGVSLLMPLIRNNDMLTTFETDMVIFMHSRAVPPLVIKGGTVERPYSADQMKDLRNRFTSRGPATNIFTRGDVEVQEIMGAARNLNVSWWLDYLLTRRMMALGTPEVMMGLPSGNRALSDVMIQEFVARIQAIQNYISKLFIQQALVPLIAAKTWDIEKSDEVEKAGKFSGKELIKKYGYPTMKWKPVIEEDRNQRLVRVLQAWQLQAVTKNEVRAEMGLNPLTEEEGGNEFFQPQQKMGFGGAPAMIPGGKNRTAPVNPKSTFGMPDQPTQDIEQRSPDFGKKVTTSPRNPLSARSEEIMKQMEISTWKSRLNSVITQIQMELNTGDLLVKDIRDIAKLKINRIIKEAKLNKIERKKYIKEFMHVVEDMIKAHENGETAYITS